MRIITGIARGKKLFPPDGMDIRPTTDMVKEAVFSMIQFEIEGAQALDLFAGSGQLGIEALSRGARHCVFVDADRRAQELVRKNLQVSGLAENSKVVAMDYAAFLSGTKTRFDLAFLDPPYQKGILEVALPKLVQKMNENGTIICECDRSEPLPDEVGGFAKTKESRYGKIKITVYRGRTED